MKHYVYRITNIKLNKHYYGTRTPKKNIPEDDIGIYYFSSSKDKEFIKDQKENPQDYKYKIIKKFNTRKEALELEIKLHNKFNVGINESFYNRSKQTSTGWDTTGISGKKGPKHSEETRKKMSEDRKGRKPSEKARANMSKAFSGSKNNNASKISIYNKEGELVYEFIGNFKKGCKEHNLPRDSFRNSYMKNIKLYQTFNSRNAVKNKDHLIYEGWYAIKN